LKIITERNANANRLIKKNNITFYNYGLPKKLISIIIKLRKSYFSKLEGLREITLSKIGKGFGK